MWTKPQQCQSYEKKTHKSIAADKLNTIQYHPYLHLKHRRIQRVSLCTEIWCNVIYYIVPLGNLCQLLSAVYSASTSVSFRFHSSTVAHCSPAVVPNTSLSQPQFVAIQQPTIGSVWSQHACSLRQQRQDSEGGQFAIPLPNAHTTTSTFQTHLVSSKYFQWNCFYCFCSLLMASDWHKRIWSQALTQTGLSMFARLWAKGLFEPFVTLLTPSPLAVYPWSYVRSKVMATPQCYNTHPSYHSSILHRVWAGTQVSAFVDILTKALWGPCLFPVSMCLVCVCSLQMLRLPPTVLWNGH